MVPRQSCEKVVEATKSMSGLSGLHNLSVRGLVDRDRRGDEEIAALRGAGVLVADVAEVENLLCLPEVLEAVAKHLTCPDVPTAKAAAEGDVLAEMAKAIDQQALSHALAEIQFRLNGFGPKIGKSDAAKLEADLQTYVGGIDVGATVANAASCSRTSCRGRTIARRSASITAKESSHSWLTPFAINKDVYSQIVMGFLKTEPDGLIAKAMRKSIEGYGEYVN